MIKCAGHSAATVTIFEEFSEVVLFGGDDSPCSAINKTYIGRLGKFVFTWEI